MLSDDREEGIGADTLNDALRLLRLANEWQGCGCMGADIRVCNNCGVGFPWKHTEQHWVCTSACNWPLWYSGTVFEQGHCVDNQGNKHKSPIGE